MAIKLLDNSLINKIAAGEVVERPASVVKELVENAIDAGATEILIEIENGGKTLITVSDNGSGINHDELLLAFSRHATSKIENLYDLENIASLGFRGEALSSISSVSNVEVITKTENDDLAKTIFLENGEVVKEKFVQRLRGTTFNIRDLFYNVPVRLKFLKKNSVESSAISEIVTNLIISNPQISFKFVNNGVALLQSEGDGNLHKIIQQIAGRDLGDKLLDVYFKNDDIEISGVISKFEGCKSNRKNEYLFINNRFIKNKMISDCIESFYFNELGNKTYPVFALNIKINPQLVDVNVHPTKLEVRFVDETAIYEAFYESIKKALECYEESKIPSVDFKVDKNDKIRLTEQQKEVVEKSKPPLTINLDQIKITDFAIAEDIATLVNVEEVVVEEKYQPKNSGSLILNDVAVVDAEKEEKTMGESIASYLYSDSNFIETRKETSFSPSKKVKTEVIDNRPRFEQTAPKPVIKHDYKIIGQVFGTYWLLEKDEELYFFDQHAGHEIYLYYKFTEDFKNSKILSQILLEPKIISLEFKQSEYLNNNLDLFKSFGYDIEVFDDNIYTLKSVPIIFEEPSSVSFFIEMIDELSDIDKSIENIYEYQKEKIMSISCRSAVKANDILTKEEAKAILDIVLSDESLLKCPHGRPTLIKISKKDVEKMFKRI